ncbi:hypothetical protein HQN89_35565 [Paenibacillus frigoriresistens]|uniref:hypothetical protein n=1 Tax=Paenibacillus alginolyticus TaxID=59839 RepID=UPI0015671CE9|nr:hypothetical protein [Paenibacillus frigoriresistens]NRF96117.1 hypothetical protein [Paenibacillus frigoriresistens]
MDLKFTKEVYQKLESKGFTVFEGDTSDMIAASKVLHNQTGHSYDLTLEFKNGKYDGFSLDGDQNLNHEIHKNYDTMAIMDLITDTIKECFV